MLVLTDLEVVIAEPDARLSGRSIDRPVAGRRPEARALEVAGWALGRESAVVAVELVHGGAVVRRAPLDLPRPDVAAAFPDAPGAARCGFRTVVSALGTVPELELRVRAVLRDGSRAPLGTIRARRGWWEPDDGADGGLVSVVIPCYGQAHFLGEAIESALRQGYPLVEVVVVDDGSRDNASEVAARYPGVRCVRQENRGLAAARNAGIRCSNGRYLVFLDADDRLLPDALQAGVEALEAHPAAAFVYGHHRPIAADGSPLPAPDPPPPPANHYEALLRIDARLTPASVMYRRAVFAAVGGFDPAVSPAADYDLYLRVARQFPVARHEATVAEYRQHGTSMTRDLRSMLEPSLAVLRAQWPHVRRNRRHVAAYRDGVRFVQDLYGAPLVDEIRGHLEGREYGPALRGILTLLRCHPRGLTSVVRVCRSRVYP